VAGAKDGAAASSETPTPQQLNSFLTQHGFNAAGFWGGVTKSYTPGLSVEGRVANMHLFHCLCFGSAGRCGEQGLVSEDQGLLLS